MAVIMALVVVVESKHRLEGVMVRQVVFVLSLAQTNFHQQHQKTQMNKLLPQLVLEHGLFQLA
jgi:hypothetical protein